MARHELSGRYIHKFPLSLVKMIPGTAPSPEQLRSYRELMRLGDPVADGLVAYMHANPKSDIGKKFKQALEHGIETVANAPQELIDFFQAVDHVPFWLDWDRLDAAASTYGRLNADNLICSITLGLGVSYVAPQANEVLLRSGDLHKRAAKRAFETLYWHQEVTAPTGMRRFSPGFKACVTVRITHAHMRRAMKSREDWDFENWNLPINQPIYAITILAFSVFLPLSVNLYGVLITPREFGDIQHLWRYIAHVSGVSQQLINGNMRDTLRHARLTLDEFVFPDPNARPLGNALLNNALDALKPYDKSTQIGRFQYWLFRSRNVAAARLIIGNELVDSLGFPRTNPAGMAALGAVFLKGAVESMAYHLLPFSQEAIRSRKLGSRNAFYDMAMRNLQPDLGYHRQ